VGVDPATPRPPVGFRIRVPDEWLRLDLDPDTSPGWVERFLDDRIATHPEAAPHRGHLRQVMRTLIGQQRDAEVFFCAILTGPGHRPSDILSASLTLAWRKLPRAASHLDVDALVALYADAPADDGEDPTARRVEPVELPAGPAARLRTTALAPIPETSRRQRVAVSQHFVPVPGTDWLGVLTVTTPNLGLTEVFDDLADRVAESLEFDPTPTTS
jgi:hypothetical protein